MVLIGLPNGLIASLLLVSKERSVDNGSGTPFQVRTDIHIVMEYAEYDRDEQRRRTVLKTLANILVPFASTTRPQEGKSRKGIPCL
jgi:hypothetical protein